MKELLKKIINKIKIADADAMAMPAVKEINRAPAKAGYIFSRFKSALPVGTAIARYSKLEASKLDTAILKV
ncbi:MAG: hypothetical protein AB7U45_04470 [Desulfamplus sp.]